MAAPSSPAYIPSMRPLHRTSEAARRGARGLAATLAVCALNASLPDVSHALPSAKRTPELQDVEAAVRKALAGTPGADRLDFYAEAPVAGISVVHAFPNDARLDVAFSLLDTPRCEQMTSAMDEVDRLNEQMANVALAGIDLALALAQARVEQLRYARNHATELELVATVASELHALDDQLAGLDTQISTLVAQIALLEKQSPPGDTAELARLRTELANVQKLSAALSADRAAMLAEPSYQAALSVQAENQRLLDVVAAARDAKEEHEQHGFDEALEAVNWAKRAFNDLARTDVASAEAAFPVWDPQMLELLVSKPVPGVKLVQGMVGNLWWDLPSGTRNVIPPLSYDVFERIGNSLFPVDELVPLSADGVESGSTVIEVITDQQTLAEDVLLASASDGTAFKQTVRTLAVPAPKVRVRIGMGTYCGNVEESRAPVAHPGLSGGNVSIAPQRAMYRFIPREPQRLFEHAAFGHFSTPMLGPSLRVRCTIESTAYQSAIKLVKGDEYAFWAKPHAWDETAPARLAKRGIVCDLPVASLLWDPSLEQAARELSELAANETTLGFMALANDGAAEARLSAAPKGESDLWIDEKLGAKLPPPNVVCVRAPCDIELVDPKVFDPVCDKLRKRCVVKTLRYTYEIVRPQIYWKPMELRSTVAFTIASAGTPLPPDPSPPRPIDLELSDPPLKPVPRPPKGKWIDPLPPEPGELPPVKPIKIIPVDDGPVLLPPAKYEGL